MLLGSLLVVLLEGLGLGTGSTLLAMASPGPKAAPLKDPLGNLVVLTYHDIA